MATTTATRERPIIFSPEMVRAILDGRKTQTRRVLKPQPEKIPPDVARVSPYDDSGYWWACSAARAMVSMHDAAGLSLYGARGELLWVRETWGQVDPTTCEGFTPRAVKTPTGTRHIVYRADNQFDEWEIDDTQDEYDSSGRRRSCWRPSIHMPRWASRLTLRITEVRVQRVQEISEADAKAEGVRKIGDWWAGEQHPVKKVPKSRESAVAAFRDLWNGINANRGFGWDANPWVWALTFEVLEAKS